MAPVAKRVWVVSIPISNFDKSLSFYRDLLGFKVQLDGRMFNWMELGPEEPLCKIGLYEWKEGLPRRYPTTTGITLDTDDIQELYKRLRASGSRFTNPPKKLEWGRMVCRLLGPGRQLAERSTGSRPLQTDVTRRHRAVDLFLAPRTFT